MDTPVRSDNDLLKKNQMVDVFRVFFTVFLLGSTIFVHYQQQNISPNPSWNCYMALLQAYLSYRLDMSSFFDMVFIFWG